MSEGNREISTVVDTLKLMASVSILFASIVSFYYFSEISVLIRALVIIFSLVISLLIFFRTQRGIIFWDFLQGSRVEM
ncbi:MAG TPA: hypothetical protein QF617_14740, partial [Arenicellales bacterium]|nr:hypothetical protein [Arenicellales bacterium]